MKDILKNSTFFFCFLSGFSVWAQSPEYLAKKQKALENPSVFEKIAKGETNTSLIYEDDQIIVFEPLKKQMPVHLLIVPKKRIPTLNDMSLEDTELLGKMIWRAKEIAKQKGISETGYRLAINTNEDAGQSVFHIHLHLLGGAKTGAMVETTLPDKAKD